MRKVMVRAWEIARRGAERFGGSSKQYLSEALRQAWAEARKPKFAVLETLTGSRKHKTWVARITAVGGKYKFVREFINDFRNLGHALEYRLADGLYDVCDGGQRSYIRVVGGQIEEWEISA